MIKIAINKKTGDKYRILREDIINCTNKDDGKLMVLYIPLDELSLNPEDTEYVREIDEFYEKFEVIKK